MSSSTDLVNQRAPGFVLKLIAPVVVAGLLALAAVLVLIWVAAHGQDEVAADASTDLMAAVMHGMEHDLRQLVFD